MSSWLVCDPEEIFRLLGDSSSNFHFLHWENNNILLLFVSYLLVIYPWKLFLSILLQSKTSLTGILESPWKWTYKCWTVSLLHGEQLIPVFLHVGRRVVILLIKKRGLEHNRSMFICSWLDLKVKSQSKRPGPSQPQTHICVLILSALFWCCSSIEQKFWNPWSDFARVTGIGYYLMHSALLFLYEHTACCCFLFRRAHSTEPWKSCQGIEVSTHMNQDHWNKALVYHKGLLSL